MTREYERCTVPSGCDRPACDATRHPGLGRCSGLAGVTPSGQAEAERLGEPLWASGAKSVISGRGAPHSGPMFVEDVVDASMNLIERIELRQEGPAAVHDRVRFSAHMKSHAGKCS